MVKKVAARKKEGIKTYTGRRVSTKQFKIFMAAAKSGAERTAIKSLVLGDPVQFYGKEEQEAPASDAA